MEHLKNNFEAYKALFVFENNLRRFIKEELEKKYDSTWFSKLNTKVQSESLRQKNQMIRYLSSSLMDDNPLNFLMLGDLCEVLKDKWDDVFIIFFNNVDKDNKYIWPKVQSKFFELELLRNCLAHNNLIDERLLTQLNANINFFKTYLPNYNDNIYSTSICRGNKVSQLLISIKESLSQRKNIPKEIIQEIKAKDKNLGDILSEYNKIPKTKDKMKAVEEFISNFGLLEKINSKLEYSYV